jgi:hypothetical protein
MSEDDIEVVLDRGILLFRHLQVRRSVSPASSLPACQPACSTQLLTVLLNQFAVLKWGGLLVVTARMLVLVDLKRLPVCLLFVCACLLAGEGCV